MRGFSQQVDETLSLLLVERHHADLVTVLWRRNAERLRRWEPWAARDPDLRGAAGWIADCLRRFAEGRQLYLLILVDGVPVGTCSLAVDESSRFGAIGYFVDSAAEGSGYVTRAARWLTGEAFRRGVEQVEIGAAVGNVRSRAVAERLGYRLDEVTVAGLEFPDRTEDRAVYVLSARDGLT